RAYFSVTAFRIYPRFLSSYIPAIKYGGGSIMVWTCFAASAPGQLAVIEGKMDSQVYLKNSSG
ncbi:hypothetical protein JRQ81_016628, partial [Phrynocephalus forsythii]